jgi:C4-dicarboxylate transporter DctQ subunit
MRALVARIVAAIDVATQHLATVTLLLAVVLNFTNVVGRYGFSAPIAWAEEVMLFMMVGIVFLGAVAVSREGRHIRMDVIVTLMPPAWQQRFDKLAAVVEIAVAAAVTYLAYPLVHMLAMFDQRSQAAELPLYIPQSLIPIGFALMAIVTAARLAGAAGEKAGQPQA